MTFNGLLYPRSATLFAAICALIFCIIGIVGNLLTILALLRNSRLKQQTTTIFIISLSLCDFIFCVFVLPIQSQRYFKDRWTTWVLLCRAFPVVLYCCIGVSLLNMVAITINRLILFAFNPWYKKIYKTTSIALQLMLIWLIPFCLLLPAAASVYGTTGYDNKTYSCTLLKKDGKSIKKIIFVLGFLLPCCVVLLSYACIYIRFLRKRQNIRQQAKFIDSNMNERYSKEEDNKISKMMVLRFVCFLVCFLPLMLANVVDDEETTKYPWFQIIASVMAWLSTVINPIIYAFSNHHYRNAYKHVLVKLIFWKKPSTTISHSETRYSADFSVELMELNYY